MAEQGVNNGRRRFLTTTTAVVGGAGAIFAATGKRIRRLPLSVALA